METQTQTIPGTRFDDVRVGDRVTRILGGRIPLELTVVKVTEGRLYCGVIHDGLEIGMAVPEEAEADAEYEGWTFCRCCGAEIDDFLHWGHGYTGSYLTKSAKVEP